MSQNVPLESLNSLSIFLHPEVRALEFRLLNRDARIVRTLGQVHGNKAVAARMLGISRRAFYRQLERHGLHHRVPMTRRDEAAPAAAAE